MSKLHIIEAGDQSIILNNVAHWSAASISYGEGVRTHVTITFVGGGESNYLYLDGADAMDFLSAVHAIVEGQEEESDD